MGQIRKKYQKDVFKKTAHLVITHGINVQSFVAYCCNNCQMQEHVKPRKFINYCGIGAGTIFGKGLRMTHGGSSF